MLAHAIKILFQGALTSDAAEALNATQIKQLGVDVAQVGLIRSPSGACDCACWIIDDLLRVEGVWTGLVVG